MDRKGDVQMTIACDGSDPEFQCLNREDCIDIATNQWGDDIDFVTYDKENAKRWCTGKTFKQLASSSVYKMITVGNCDRVEMEENKFNTGIRFKQDDKLISFQKNDNLDWEPIDSINQCREGTQWLSDQNLIIPGGTWVDDAIPFLPPPPRPPQPLNRPLLKCPDEGKATCEEEGEAPETDQVTSPEISINEDGESILSAYLGCGVHEAQSGTKKGKDINSCINFTDAGGYTSANYPAGQQNHRRENSKFAQTTVTKDPDGADTIRAYLDTHKRSLPGSFGPMPDHPFREPPGGADGPYEPTSTNNPDTPNGCYVNLSKSGTKDSTRTGSLAYNSAITEVPASILRPKICRAVTSTSGGFIPEQRDTSFSLIYI